MNNFLAAERGKKAPEIEMPGLTEEQVVQAVEPEVEVSEPDQVEEQVQTAPSESDRDRNFRALREKAERAERAERERDEALRYIESLRQAKPVEPELDEEIFSEDDYDEAKLSKVSSTVKALRKEIKQLKQDQQRSSTTSLQTQLRVVYPDIDNVLSQANVNQLITEYPELAESLESNPNHFNKVSATYKMVKKLGIYQEPVSYKADIDRVKTNTAKPRPLTSVNPQQAESPLARVNAFENGLTKELQSQLHREMIEAMKGR